MALTVALRLDSGKRVNILAGSCYMLLPRPKGMELFKRKEALPLR